MYLVTNTSYKSGTHYEAESQMWCASVKRLPTFSVWKGQKYMIK